MGTANLRAEERETDSLPRETAVFAAGCFWCIQSFFDQLHGVISTTVGYTGGSMVNPSYEQVSSGTTGHIEAIQVQFDPKIVSYEELLRAFWANVDPTDKGGQFCDRGTQYRSAIFVKNEPQREAAQRSKTALEESSQLNHDIATEILELGTFYPAEEYHQSYYRKNPLRYKTYRLSCGRDKRLESIWGSGQ